MSQRDRRALILGGVGLGTIGLYLLVIQPMVDRYAALVERHAELSARTARFASDADRNAYMDKQIEEWEAKAGKLSKPRPYSEQISAVSDQLVTASQKSGMQMRNSSWSQATVWAGDPLVDVANLQIEAEASWENIFKFIAELYAIEGVLSVEELDLSGDAKKGDKLTVRLHVSVLVEPARRGKGAPA